jgi:hypothetical protein
MDYRHCSVNSNIKALPTFFCFKAASIIKLLEGVRFVRSSITADLVPELGATLSHIVTVHLKAPHSLSSLLITSFQDSISATAVE